jgi:hypothetical protein
MKSLLAVVCANGLGHFRRMVAVLDRLWERSGPFDLTIAAEGWQWERTRDWPASARLRNRARHRPGIVEPGVRLYGDPAVYDDDRLVAWEERLGELDEVGSADLVISDNLVGVLDVRTDAVLMGSFLWSDVLAAAHSENRRVSAFAAHERRLLDACRPPMLSVGDLAMPGVLERTTPIQLPWMCETRGAEPRELPSQPPRIGVFGGVTGRADHLLDAVAEALSEKGLGVERGGESSPRFESYDLVILRPGCGTATACIAARAPMILIYEANAELIHNAGRLEALGVALDAGCNPDPKRVCEVVDRALKPQLYRAMSVRMAVLPDDGIDRAVSFLCERLP